MSADPSIKKRKRDPSDTDDTATGMDDGEEKTSSQQVGLGSVKKMKSSDTEEEEDDFAVRPSFSMKPNNSSDNDPSPSLGSGGIGSKLLKLAGYSGVGGLGKHGTGIAEPVAASNQISTEGIGFQGAVKRQQHVFEAFKVEIELKPTWLISPPSGGSTSLPTTAEMANWMREGERDPTQISDDRYCSTEVQSQLLAAKTAFDDVPSMTFRSARERSNPFEKIKGEFFQNRAALKMAEMDAMCGRIFTSPPVIRTNKKRELVYVGDICAGPGGFSEFILTVLKWRAAVCGFTLKEGASDFNTYKFNRNAPTESFHAYYGADETGDITKSENIRDYRAKIMTLTHGKGLHVIMGDGGFSVVGRENLQEYLSRQLVLCQFLTALCTLQKGGVFVCKLFDSFLPFTVDLLWILRTHFTHFSLIKPNQSRPANSERYVVVHGLKQANPDVVEYLFRVNDRINELKKGYTSQASDLINIDFAASRDEATRARDRRIKEAKAAAAASSSGGQFVSGGKIHDSSSTAATIDPEADRGDGKDLFGRDLPTKMETDSPAEGDKVKKETVDTVTNTDEVDMEVDNEMTIKAEAKLAQSSAATSSPVSRERDILGLVPAHILAADTEFISYMTDRNESIARRQIFTLHRLKQYVEDPNLESDDQEAIREQCLKFWGLTQEPLPALPPIKDILRRMPKSERQKKRRSSSSRRHHHRSSRRSRKKKSSKRSRSDSRSSRSSGSSNDSSRSRSRLRSRSSSSSSSSSDSSRSLSRTPSPSRSPSPAPTTAVTPFKKGYVHYDPLWQTKLFDPSFPSNPQSIFWTSAQVRRMVQYHIPDELKKQVPILPLPTESERAALRLHAQQYPTDPLDPRMVQLDAIARSARSWYILPVPTGGIRHTVWFSLSGMGHIDEKGYPHFWAMEPKMKVPPDTLLDVVWSGGKMYVLDAYALPTPSDLFMYRTRGRLLERQELIDMFIESCGEERLARVKPIPLLEWKHAPLMKQHPPTHDLFLLRDGLRPPPSVSYSWTTNDELSFAELNTLLLYIEAKQAPITPPARH